MRLPGLTGRLVYNQIGACEGEGWQSDVKEKPPGSDLPRRPPPLDGGPSTHVCAETIGSDLCCPAVCLLANSMHVVYSMSETPKSFGT